MTKSPMNQYEIFACAQVFHSFPMDKTFQEIIDLCEDEEKMAAFEKTTPEEEWLSVNEEYEGYELEYLSPILNGFVRMTKNHFPIKYEFPENYEELQEMLASLPFHQLTILSATCASLVMELVNEQTHENCEQCNHE